MSDETIAETDIESIVIEIRRRHAKNEMERIKILAVDALHPDGTSLSVGNETLTITLTVDNDKV